MKTLGIATVFLGGLLFLYGTLFLPDFAGPESPASRYLSPYFLENSIAQTEVPNVVTAVLADYRGYDTMFETAVIFAAGLACFFLLRQYSGKPDNIRLYRHKSTGIIFKVEHDAKSPKKLSNFERIDSHWTPYDVIVKSTCRIVLPLIQVFALYVIAHGHHSPGGGFQGGVILGATAILFALSYDLRRTVRIFSERQSALIAIGGVFLYAGTGLLCLILGMAFLDYGALAPLLGVSKTVARSHGILIVEVGVGMAVMAIMIWIYCNLSSAGKYDEGL